MDPSPRPASRDKVSVLAIYREHGLAEAWRRTGVPKPTILRWVDADGMKRNQRRERVEARRLSREEMAATLAQQWLSYSRELVERALRAQIKTDNATDLKSLITAAAILLDKSQLLAGLPTHRVESLEPDRISSLRDELAERRRRREHAA